MFRYSDKGKRLMDLVIGETKGKVEKVMEIEGRVGREWVVVKEGELGIGKIERVKTTKEGKVMEKLNICRTYSTTHSTCTSLTSSTTSNQTTIIAGYSNSELFIIRLSTTKAQGEEVLRLDLKEHLNDQPIPSSLRIHTEDSSMFLLPLSSTLLLINLPPPTYTTAATTTQPPLILPSSDWIAQLPCFDDQQSSISIFAMSKMAEGCAVVERGEEGRICLLSLEETNVEKREFKIGEEISSLEYLTKDRLIIGTSSGKVLMKDLNILEEMAMELMSTEGEEITGLLLQPDNPSSQLSSQVSSLPSSHHPIPRSSSAGTTSRRKDKVEITSKVSRSASIGVLKDGDGGNRNGRVRQVGKTVEMKSRHSIAGGTFPPFEQTEDVDLTLPANPKIATHRRTKPEPPRSTSTTAMSRALSRAEAMADVSRSTLGMTVESGIEHRSSSSATTSRRSSVVPSERTRDITLPSMSADSSSATIRPSMHFIRHQVTIPAEEIDVETTWAMSLIRQQDEEEERQWDEWAEKLVGERDARESMGMGRERVESSGEITEMERLRMEVVEVQMRSIRMARDLKTSMITLLQPLRSELLSTKQLVSEQAKEIERLREMVGVLR